MEATRNFLEGMVFKIFSSHAIFRHKTYGIEKFIYLSIFSQLSPLMFNFTGVYHENYTLQMNQAASNR